MVKKKISLLDQFRSFLKISDQAKIIAGSRRVASVIQPTYELNTPVLNFERARTADIIVTETGSSTKAVVDKWLVGVSSLKEIINFSVSCAIKVNVAGSAPAKTIGIDYSLNDITYATLATVSNTNTGAAADFWYTLGSTTETKTSTIYVRLFISDGFAGNNETFKEIRWLATVDYRPSI